jgi:chemotaxis signal transduction protein
MTPGEASALERLLDRPVSGAELAAAGVLAARPAEARGRGGTGHLIFRIGRETAALPARLLRRVTPAVPVVPIPHRSSNVLRGMCNIRGELVLCADLRRLLDLPDRGEEPPGGDDSRRMIVIGPAHDCWALEVDGLAGVERLDPASLRPPPVTVAYALRSFTAGVGEIDGRCVTVLDGDRILAGIRSGIA